MELRKWNERTGRTEAETRVVSVSIPVELHESVKELAEAEGSSVSAVIETSLERALKSVKKGLVKN